MEEKGSDVNLAAHLLNDAWKGLFDVAAVISNDTDLVTAIRMMTVERGKPVIVVCPRRWQAAPKLKSIATRVQHTRLSMLKAAQFPDQIPGTTISKPASWCRIGTPSLGHRFNCSLFGVRNLVILA